VKLRSVQQVTIVSSHVPPPFYSFIWPYVIYAYDTLTLSKLRRNSSAACHWTLCRLNLCVVKFH